MVTVGESTAASLVSFELEAGDGVGEFGHVGGVRVCIDVTMCIEGATVASLCAFPDMALSCVGVRVFPEDAHVIEVWSGVGRRPGGCGILGRS